MSEINKSLRVLTDESVRIIREIQDAEGELTPDLEAEFSEIAVLLPTKIDNYDVRFRVLSSEEALIDERIEELTILKKRIKVYKERLDKGIIEAMLKLGQEKLTGFIAEFKLKLAGGKAALHVNELELPPAYIKVVTTNVPDNERIRAALEAGEAIPGCTLTRKWTLKKGTIGGK